MAPAPHAICWGHWGLVEGLAADAAGVAGSEQVAVDKTDEEDEAAAETEREVAAEAGMLVIFSISGSQTFYASPV